MIFFIFNKIFNFLSSLKLAVVVILSLAYILALGTFYESMYSAAIAKQKVYDTSWFSLILFFLGINVLFAALSRVPWKKHHIGFLVTHAGIITILIGAFITQQKGVEGTLALSEGEMDDRMVVDEPLLQVANAESKAVHTWKVKFSKTLPSPQKPWTQKLKDGSTVTVNDFYPSASPLLEVKELPSSEQSAIQLLLTGLPGGQQDLTEWVFSKNEGVAKSKTEIGPAKIYFLSLEELQKGKTGDSDHPLQKGKLTLQFQNEKKLEISLQELLQKQTVSFPEIGGEVKLIRYLPDAVVRGGKLISRSDQPVNPAIEFEWKTAQTTQVHLVFAQFPDLEAIHGTKNHPVELKAFLEVEKKAGGMANLSGELLLAIDSNQKIWYRVRSRAGLTDPQTVEVGKTTPTGWMTIQFKIQQFIPHADVSIAYKKVTLPPGKTDGPPPTIRLNLEKDGVQKEEWLQQGDLRTITIGGIPYIVRYGLRAHPLGVSIKLNDFKMGKYPGTNNPKSYESFVEVTDLKTGGKEQAKIHMNTPLQMNGYTFYQSSYQENPDGTFTSIFSIAKDPGTWVKYTGSILLVSGIILMFWFKPLFIQQRKKETLKEGII